MRRPATTYSAEPLSHFVDEYLGYLYEGHPTAAAVDGVHTHDDLLEDFSRIAIDEQVRELGGWARRLECISPSTLTSEEKLDRRMLGLSIRARLFELEEVRPWQRAPLHYAETLASSLASQVFFAHAPVTDRARRVVSKLRQVPRFLEAARQNVTDPPGLYVKVGLESLERLLVLIERDLPRAFRDLEDMHVLGDLADASNAAVNEIRVYVGHLRDVVAPRSRASFRLGPERFAEKLRLGEGLDVPAERLLQIALRELQVTQEEFKEVASKIHNDPAEAWRQVKARHPASGELLEVVEGQLEDLVTFIRRKRLVTIPKHETVVVAATPKFYRGTFASLWFTGPFEQKELPAHYYITDVDPNWSAERQDEHLRNFNYATLWSVSRHKVFPGHFLRSEHVRRIEAPLRRSGLFASRSFVEGWAHYGEQLMLDEGFERDSAEIKLGQLAEALVRLTRTVVGIRLHTEDLSVEQGVRLFRDKAYLEEGTARHEAERGTFDPGYVLYALGKLMLLKLRADVEVMQGKSFSLQRFHDRLLGQGCLPFWMHRELMVGGRGASLLE